MNKVKKMTHYHWDLQRIKTKINKLEEKIADLEETSNDKENEYVIDYLIRTKNFYHYLLSCYNISKISNFVYDSPFYASPLEEAKMMDEEQEEKKLDTFLSNPYYIPKSLITVSTNGLKYADGYWDIDGDSPSLYIDNQELLEVFDDFIHEMGCPALYHRIQQEKSNIELNIQKRPKYFYSTYGCCYGDSLFNDKYINLFRDNTIQDISTLAHEFFHAFYSNLSFRYTYHNELCYFSELEGMFAQVLVAEYYRKLGQEENAYFIDVIELDDYILRNFQLNLGFLLAKKDRKITLNELNRDLSKKNIQITFTDKKKAFEYLNESASKLLIHNLSYLASLDLFELYLQDREKAFVKLEKIKELDYHRHLIRFSKENGFTFMEKDCPSLQKHLKRLEKSKKDMSLS